MRIAPVLIFCFFISCLMQSAHAAPPDPFVGSWKITVTPDDKSAKTGEKEFEDTLTFKDGQFVSEACKKYGFTSVRYDPTYRGIGNVAHFQANPVSENEGKSEWTGTTTTGQNLTGKLVWTKKDGTIMRYDLAGAKAEK